MKKTTYVCLLFFFSALCVFAAPQDTTTTNIPKPPVDSSQHIADKIIKSKIPVIVDFWAPWCGPCRTLNPILAELEKEYHGKVVFMKVNIDIHRGIANYFGVNSIPAVFLIKNKTVVRALPGLHPKIDYVTAIDTVLKMEVTPPQEPTNAESKK